MKIGDSVTIIEISRPGRVDAIMHESEGTSYKVIYWNEGRRYVEWMKDWEVKPK